MFNLSEKGFKGLVSGYTNSLTGYSTSVPMLIVLLLTIALNFYLIAIIPKGFFPQQDTAHCGRVQAAGCILRGDGQFRAATGGCDQGRPAVANVNAYTDHQTAASSISR